MSTFTLIDEEVQNRECHTLVNKLSLKNHKIKHTLIYCKYNNVSNEISNSNRKLGFVRPAKLWKKWKLENMIAPLVFND